MQVGVRAHRAGDGRGQDEEKQRGRHKYQVSIGEGEQYHVDCAASVDARLKHLRSRRSNSSAGATLRSARSRSASRSIRRWSACTRARRFTKTGRPRSRTRQGAAAQGPEDPAQKEGAQPVRALRLSAPRERPAGGEAVRPHRTSTRRAEGAREAFCVRARRRARACRPLTRRGRSVSLGASASEAEPRSHGFGAGGRKLTVEQRARRRCSRLRASGTRRRHGRCAPSSRPTARRRCGVSDKDLRESRQGRFPIPRKAIAAGKADPMRMREIAAAKQGRGEHARRTRREAGWRRGAEARRGEAITLRALYSPSSTGTTRSARPAAA